MCRSADPHRGRPAGSTASLRPKEYFNPERKHAAERVRRQMRGSVLDEDTPAEIGAPQAAVVPAAPSVDDVIAALTEDQRKELARKLLGL